jgi:hypothetical protein
MKIYAIQAESLKHDGKYGNTYYRSETDLVGGGIEGEDEADYALAETLEKETITSTDTFKKVTCVEGYNYKVRLATEGERFSYQTHNFLERVEKV